MESYRERRTRILKDHFPEWLRGDGFEAEDILWNYGSDRWALLYSLLFLPDLEELDGAVVLSRNVGGPEMRRRFLQGRMGLTGGELERFEASFSWVEPADLLNAAANVFDDDEEQFLAERVAESWSNLLAARYPERTFIVEVIPPEVTGHLVGVGFYEKRDDSL